MTLMILRELGCQIGPLAFTYAHCRYQPLQNCAGEARTRSSAAVPRSAPRTSLMAPDASNHRSGHIGFHDGRCGLWELANVGRRQDNAHEAVRQ